MILVNNLWERPASLKWKSVHLTAKQQHSNAKICSSQISRCFVANIHSCCVQALLWNFAESVLLFLSSKKKTYYKNNAGQKKEERKNGNKINIGLSL